MPINVKPFGKATDGHDATLYEITNANGMRLSLTDFGATVVSIVLPVNGVKRDVVLGFDDVEGYEKTTQYLGATIGRYAGQIKDGTFMLNGSVYHTYINDHSNTLHGGYKGFNKRFFLASLEEPQNSIRFYYHSPDGEEGFPGNLEVRVTFSLTEDNNIVIDYHCTCDADTILNMTNHNYYNLNGHHSGSILNHSLWIDADQFLELANDCSPNGNLLNVCQTPMDFRQNCLVGERIAQSYRQLEISEGYDHNWVIREYDGNVKEIVRLSSDNGDLTLSIASDLPGLQMYSGNYLNGHEVGKNGCHYGYRSGMCLEPQYYPNAMSYSHFPSPILKKGTPYNHTIRLSFTSL